MPSSSQSRGSMRAFIRGSSETIKKRLWRTTASTSIASTSDTCGSAPFRKKHVAELDRDRQHVRATRASSNGRENDEDMLDAAVRGGAGSFRWLRFDAVRLWRRPKPGLVSAAWPRIGGELCRVRRQ